LILPDHISEFNLETHLELLQTVISHLIANAIKFTLQGTITITLEILPSMVKISGSDSGIGIDQESQRMIFEKFKQVDGSSNRTYQGSGLGLSICHGILKLLGSEIHFESEVNKGTTCYFTLSVKEFAEQQV